MSNSAPGVKVTAPSTNESNQNQVSAESSSNSYSNRDGSPSSLETVQPTTFNSAGSNLSNNPSSPKPIVNGFASSTYSPPSSNSQPLPSSSSSPDGNSAPVYRPGHRKRSSSIITVEKIETSHEEMLDQAAGFNANADWVNYKGAWVIHIVLILLGKILLDVVPGMEQDISWSVVNLGYIGVSTA